MSTPPTEEQIYGALRAAIGAASPGGRLESERALARLAGEGVIERRLGRAGSRVRMPDLTPPATADVPEVSPQDVLEARLAIEPGFADLVVARATEDDFARMAACLERMEAAPTQQAFREAGYDFHLEMARSTRNPLVVHLFRIIIAARARVGWGRLRALNERPDQRAVQIARNWRTLACLRERDTEAARRALREHLATMVREVAGLTGPE